MAKADGPLPRDIVTRDAIDNAFTIDMAMGGSSNTVLHTLAASWCLKKYKSLCSWGSSATL